MGAQKVTFHVDFSAAKVCIGRDFKADPNKASIMRAALAVEPGASPLLISYGDQTVWAGSWKMTNEQLKKLG